MIPILYESTEKSFNHNGIGRLSDAIECVVTEERNGIYTLAMKYPITGIFYEEIKVDRIIYAKPFDTGSNQPFRIFKVSAPLNGVVDVDAQHISYDLNKMVVKPYKADTCSEALELIKSNSATACDFAFSTDKSVIAKFNNKTPRAIRGLLGGEENSILDVYGKGDYEFDNKRVILHTNRGVDNGVTLRYGKNISELQNVIDMSNTYTGIVPFWVSDDEVTMLPEIVVLSEHAGQYANYLLKAVDFSSDFESQPSAADLRQRAKKYIETNEGWTLKNNVTVSFVNLLDTEEYKDIVSLERVRMCDIVTVKVEPLGVDVKARVIRTEYDALAERYNEIEIGESKPSLSQVIAEQVSEPIVQATSNRMADAIRTATALITGGKGGHLIIGTDTDGRPNELLIMNTDDKNTATQVLRINMNGIGFGKSYVGPFTTAWTLDGHFVANYIDTGTLNADLIRTGILRALNNSNNYWNMQTGEFHLRSNGAATGIDFKNGVLAINASNITTGNLSANRIKGGSLVSQNGQTSFDLNNAEIVCRSEDGKRVTTLGQGTLKASAQGYPDIQIQSHSSILNLLTLEGAFYAKSTAYFHKTVHAEGDITTNGSLQATWNVNAGGDVSGTHLYGQLVNGSDRKRKRDIEILSAERALDFIMALLPRTFAYLEGDGRTHHGFVAQEVEDAMEGDDWSVYQKYADEKGETCGISYHEIIADLVAVAQKQQKQIEELENRIIALEENR